MTPLRSLKLEVGSDLLSVHVGHDEQLNCFVVVDWVISVLVHTADILVWLECYVQVLLIGEALAGLESCRDRRPSESPKLIPALRPRLSHLIVRREYRWR